MGFSSQVTSWPNPSAWTSIEGNLIFNRETDGKGVYTDVADMNGDGLPDRIVKDRISPYTPPDSYWAIYFNNGNGFNEGTPWYNPSAWGEIMGNYIYNAIPEADKICTYTNLIDLNGDGRPDRIVYDRTPPYKPPNSYWTVYFNNVNNSFSGGVQWYNPSAWLGGGNSIQENDSKGILMDVIDMNGDGLPDRVVYSRLSNNTWKVYFNNGNGFDSGIDWPNPSYWEIIGGSLQSGQNHIRETNSKGTYSDVIDMNGDGLPDRVVYSQEGYPWYPSAYWKVYFNYGNGFDSAVDWPNPSFWQEYYYGGYVYHQNYIRETNHPYYAEPPDYNGIYSDVFDINGDGLPDRVVKDLTGPYYNTWKVYLNNGSSFGQGIDWPNPSGLNNIRQNLYYGGIYGTIADIVDLNGDGLPDRVVRDATSPYTEWSVYKNNGPFPDLLSKVENSIGGSIEITYTPSTQYVNTFLPFVIQTVSSYTQKDGKGNSYLYKYDYSGGYFDPGERKFMGFRTVTAYQMIDPQYYEAKTETTFHQDYYRNEKIETQIITSKEGHTKQTANTWLLADTLGGGKFPYLDTVTTTITDQGAGGPFSYSHVTKNIYDIRPSDLTYQTLNLLQEHKNEGGSDEIDIQYEYTSDYTRWILSKPTKVTVTDGSGIIYSRKWIDYNADGDLITEELCSSMTPNSGCINRNPTQNVITSYQYDPTYKVLTQTTDPRGYITTQTYESTKTFVYDTSKCVSQPNVQPGPSCTNTHTTTTEYDLGTGNLKKTIPPHLQGTAYSITYTYDVHGRRTREDRPDGGWTSYQYLYFGNPNTPPNLQHVKKKEHIIGGPSVLDHYTYNYFDGMGRIYWLETTGPEGKRIITETWYDNIGRVLDKSNPYYYGIDTPYYTTYTYDGLSRVIDILTPDDYHIGTSYQGLKKVVTNQRGYPTAYTYDVFQRLKKVEDAYGTLTEYSYDPLNNLTQVIAAKDATEQNTTTMFYDSLSKKRAMTDPDMGYWTYQYDKSGNLISQTDAKNQTITFNYDGLNRVTQKVYPDRTVTYTYDDPSVSYSKGKLTKVSDPFGGELKEDSILEYDLMQREKKTKKKIGAEEVTFEKTYDSAGKVLSTKYLAGTPNEKTYSFEYDVAGNLLYIKDNATGNHLVDYSDFTALGQQKIANFPKPNNVSVKTTYTYYPDTGRIHTLLTQKLVGGSPVETYQNLDYQNWDGKGNLVTLADLLNSITHSYTYDSLDRLLTADGAGINAYSQSFGYDRIGNITYKSDVGSYSYTYSNKPHAVQSAGPYSFTYDANGNMTQKVESGVTTTIQWNYDNKPTSITNGSVTVSFTYDGNSQRIRKQSSVSGTTLYFGELYETRGGVGTIHVFARNQRVISVFLDGTTQFYHTNHLGSASVVTNQNGDRKEQIEYFPFGTYRAVGDPLGTYDYDPNFPDVFYTFTGQEDDDDLGLYNYKARMYDPTLGRFISPDPYMSPNLALSLTLNISFTDKELFDFFQDPQNLNRYIYALNNPLHYTDPSGHVIITPNDAWNSFVTIPCITAVRSAAQDFAKTSSQVLQVVIIHGLYAFMSLKSGVDLTIILTEEAINNMLHPAPPAKASTNSPNYPPENQGGNPSGDNASGSQPPPIGPHGEAFSCPY